MSSFDMWFERATGGLKPYPYQRALALEDPMPELLEVPTGTGKTAAAVLAWLWRRRNNAASTPRRLVYCLPMRSLVKQTSTCAVRWLANLELLAGKATFDGDRLASYEIDWQLEGKVAVVTLMGGQVRDDWREHPEHEIIIVGTQEMLLSRALNRGFAMAPQEWPIDFGFLNLDAFWVMDEVQLMGVGRTTSVQLQQFWDKAPPPHGLRRTLWMSATLGSKPGSDELPDWMRSPERASRPLTRPAHRHSDADLAYPAFEARWIAPKELELRLEPPTEQTATAAVKNPGRKKSAPAVVRAEGVAWTIESPQLLEEICEEAKEGRLVLVFVNQVRRARELYDRLRQFLKTRAELILIHGRMRPYDRKTLESVLQGPTPASGRIVVSTQVLEAGFDLDADSLFTELCPWPSLVQRLGRLNRSGTKPSAKDVVTGKRMPARAVVFEPPSPARNEDESDSDYEKRRGREKSLPYDPLALEEARKLLEKIETTHNGSLSPRTVSALEVSLPLEGPVLREFDLDDLFDTDPDLSGGYTDVTPYLRAADREVDCYVLWRKIVGGNAVDEQVPVHPDELCPLPFREARKAFAQRDIWILTLFTDRKGRSAWRKASAGEINAGDTVMVDRAAGCYSEGTGWTAKADDLPALVVDLWNKGSGQLVRAWTKVDDDGSIFISEIDDRIVGPRARLEDHRCFTKQWMELNPHLLLAEQKAAQLASALGLSATVKDSLVLAARWHDVGKALERKMGDKVRRPFQEMLLAAGVAGSGHPNANTLYAKSNGSGGPSPGFRHEVASLLAFLQSKQADDLAAFLILAHHGKVRTLPQAWDEDDPVDLCGVREGDSIPAAALPAANSPLSLDLKPILPSRMHRGWQGRVRQLLDRYGPFFVAYLEGLVRVADWRAS